MKNLIIIAVTTLSLAGCFVRSSGPSERTTVVKRSCPPAHHWDGGQCVHNGNAYGHKKEH